MQGVNRNRILIFLVMALVFLGSVFVKQFLDTGSFLPEGGSNGILKVEGAEELPEKSSLESEAGEPAVSVPVQFIVDVEGAVAQPGVVSLPEGSRVFEAVEAAGGALDTADKGRVNLAEKITDGTAIYIPFQGEDQSARTPGISSGTSAVTGASGEAGGGLININTADKSTLMQLPGIGEVYAQSIIDYRQSVGAFQKPEDIKNVSGIGDAKFQKLKDRITV